MHQTSWYSQFAKRTAHFWQTARLYNGGWYYLAVVNYRTDIQLQRHLAAGHQHRHNHHHFFDGFFDSKHAKS